VNVLAALYGAIVRRRRARLATPHRQRHLSHPVISVGGLTVGGSGKTPVVASLARLLQAMGERPVILSRGYARRRPADGVVVVSDAAGVLVPTAESGDEPQMLGRALPGVPVMVCPDRYVAGRLAERRFGATVLLLDDGFQHLALARDVDVLVVSPADLDERLLPFGRLREPIETARAADAVVLTGPGDDTSEVAARLGVTPAFRAVVRYGVLAHVAPFGRPAVLPPGARVAAVAGIARPGRFFEALGARGYEVAATRAFRDHHAYSARDLRRLAAWARETGADALVTTEKDAVRIETAPPGDLPLLYLPYGLDLEPAAEVTRWLDARLAAARDAGIAGAA
jgi:tetraacyldisaccharide 4'-kinase